MSVKWFFLGNGSSGIYDCKSRLKYCWHFKNDLDFTLIEKVNHYCQEIWIDVKFKIWDIRKSTLAYRIWSGTKRKSIEPDECYTNEKEKRVLDDILTQ